MDYLDGTLRWRVLATDNVRLENIISDITGLELA
jgi:hypothetical protein